jgi:hypothetical protein
VVVAPVISFQIAKRSAITCPPAEAAVSSGLASGISFVPADSASGWGRTTDVQPPAASPALPPLVPDQVPGPVSPQTLPPLAWPSGPQPPIPYTTSGATPVDSEAQARASMAFGGATSAFTFAIRAAHQPVDNAGRPLYGNMILYSEIPGNPNMRAAAEAAAARTGGYTLKDLPYYQQAVKAEADLRSRTGILEPDFFPPDLFKNAYQGQIWGPASASSVADNTASFFGRLQTVNDVANIPQGKVQVLYEIPTYQRVGGVMAGLTTAGGLLTLWGASRDPNETRADLGYGAGGAQLGGGVLQMLGAANVSSNLGSLSGNLLLGGKLLGTAGGALVGGITLWQASDEWSSGDPARQEQSALNVATVIAGYAAGPEAAAGVGLLAAFNQVWVQVVVDPTAAFFADISTRGAFDSHSYR